MDDRRYIPEGGLQRHRERIHKESKIADNYKNLPFSFSKPKKNKRSVEFMCMECGRIFVAPFNTVMYDCPVCKKLTNVGRKG